MMATFKHTHTNTHSHQIELTPQKTKLKSGITWERERGKNKKTHDGVYGERLKRQRMDSSLQKRRREAQTFTECLPCTYSSERLFSAIV